MPPLLRKLFLSVVAVAASALVLEGLLKAGLFGTAGLVPDLVRKDEVVAAHWHQPDTDFTWVGQADKPREFSVPSRWNHLGYNDRDYPFEKEPGTERIVVLGDSYVDAVQVPRDKSFSKRLEASLNASAPPGRRYEVVALGMSGAGPKYSLEALRQVGLRFSPDIVVFEFLGLNDVSDDSEELSKAFREQTKRLGAVSSRVYLPEIWKPSPEASWMPFADSRLAVFLGQSWNDLVYKFRVARLGTKDGIPHFWHAFRAAYDEHDPYDRAWIEGWKNTPNFLRDAKQVSEAAGAKFLVARFTDRSRVAPGGIRELYTSYPAMLAAGMDFDKDAKVMGAFTRENGIEYLDLFPPFREQWTDDRPLHYLHDGHWTEAGHEVAAAALEAKLRGEGWIR